MALTTGQSDARGRANRTPAPDFSLRPLLVFWETTRACHLACRHCRADAIRQALPGELSAWEGRGLIRQVAAFGRPSPVLVFTGGDCLMRPDLFDLAECAAELNPKAVMQTLHHRTGNDDYLQLAAGSQNEVWLATVGLVTLAAFDPLRSLPDAFQRLERGRVAASRVFDLADRPPPVRNPPRPLPVRSGTLALEGAWLRYQPRGPWVLAGVDLKLHPGRRVALVGPSGAGKTTLAHVLVRFLDLDHGRVTLGGLDLRECDQEEVRRLVGLCAQDAHVFDTTLYENIRLARPEATRTEVEEAARRAGLLSWICSLPRGWETPAGDSGDLLSGGQRQRLALARALLAGFPILILDEPTAHLDSATADRLLADLLSSTRGLTLLLITHRLRGLEAMDEVIVLDRGRVVQRGTPADLAARPGLYRSLLAMAGEAGQQTPVRMWERDLAIPAAHNSRRTSVGTTCGGTVGSR